MKDLQITYRNGLGFYDYDGSERFLLSELTYPQVTPEHAARLDETGSIPVEYRIAGATTPDRATLNPEAQEKWQRMLRYVFYGEESAQESQTPD